MRTKFLMSLAIAGALSFSTAFAQANENSPGYRAPAAPEAADQTLGMALMSASVLAGCSSNRGAGLASVESEGVGLCKVTFDREVRNCTLVVSPGAFGTVLGGAGWKAYTDYIPGAENDNSVQVRTYNSADGLANSSFHLIVFCWR